MRANERLFTVFLLLFWQELKINVGGRKAIFKAVLRVDHVFRNRFQSIERDLELDKWFALLASQQDITTIFSVPRFVKKHHLHCIVLYVRVEHVIYDRGLGLVRCVIFFYYIVYRSCIDA